VTQTGDFQPVEIISKPTPVYTEEARRLGIQGEVTLSVVFQASGTIRVMSVVKSLGHGLDQAAQQAAMQIRFKPARRSGQPEDFPATLRIQFRLGGQPS
jgi:protein TonB